MKNYLEPVVFESIKLNLLDFIDGRPWDRAGLTVEVSTGYTGIKDKWLSLNGAVVRKSNTTDTGEYKWSDNPLVDAADKVISAFITEVYKTSNPKIRSLIFSMDKHDQYTVEYDHTQPAWLQDQTDQTQQEVGLDGVASLMSIEPSVFSQPAVVVQADEAMQALQQKTDALSNAWGLGTEQDWNLDLNAGSVRFTFPNGKVVQAEVQVVGTLNTQDQTWLWAWDHPSIPQPLRKSALELKALGAQLDEVALINRQIACSELDAWKLTALATAVTQADGAYRGYANGTWVYFTFNRPRLV